jgi:anti-sigma regulatory factor (Ser/Thr protein kinase)
MLWLCDIRFPAVGSGVRKARNLVDALGLMLPAEVRDDLRLLVSEVVTNAIRHGGPDGDGSRACVRVRIGLEGQRLRVEIIDRGPGFEPAPRGPMSQLDSGWGVHFVDHLADRWGAGRVQDDWVVWFELRVPRRPDTSATVTFAQRADERARMGNTGAVRHATQRARTG